MREYHDLWKDRVYENQGFLELVNLIESGHRRVLDVGCGNGANMRLLAARGHEVVGVTLSEAEAKVVQEQGFTCQVWDIAEEALPFAARSFDALLFSHVLEHVAWPTELLKNYIRLLREGGGCVYCFAECSAILSALSIFVWTIPLYGNRPYGSNSSEIF